MSSNRDIFSKHLPNVKLATRIDAEGREVQVERREDVDATVKELETFDMLVAAGYYRARIKGLSPFDKVVGGMTWCIECCDYDVDVDLLFHENLTIGQKIALVEKIVSVLPQMKCPFQIEPHQIQGLEFLSIHPVIQWLVKKSVENRAERAQRLKKFAIGQFHNHYQYKTDKEQLAKIRNASAHIKRIQELYNPVRAYQRKDAGNEDEKTRVRMTLLEYGCAAAPSATNETRSGANDELDVHKLFKNLSLTKENITCSPTHRLDASERSAMHRHYTELQQEMETDAKQLSEHSQIKMLEASKVALERNVQSNLEENKEIEAELEKQKQQLQQYVEQKQELQAEIEQYKAIEAKADPELVTKVHDMLKKHDKLKKEEAEFKEFCRQDLANLQKEIE
uniref:Coiled-coil domain-containing protein 93 n=1 Tax=Bactrocera latifrons TaxID=174628 RepID=A0A0K8U9S3_BACLA